MTAQGDRQASVRAVSGSTSTYEGDWLALFDGAGIAAGDFNGRFLSWINLKLSASFTEINGAMAALAAFFGIADFGSLGTFDASLGASSAVLNEDASFILLEDGASKLLLG